MHPTGNEAHIIAGFSVFLVHATQHLTGSSWALHSMQCLNVVWFLESSFFETFQELSLITLDLDSLEKQFHFYR